LEKEKEARNLRNNFGEGIKKHLKIKANFEKLVEVQLRTDKL
jgi:hypothetical protein